jgi:hypothetical protein
MEIITDTPSLEAYKALTYSEQEEIRIRANLKHITDFMMVYGVAEIEASYSGDCDSGNGFDLDIRDAQGNYLAGIFSKPAMMMRLDGEIKQYRVQELVEIFTGDLVDYAGHGGYEINDGGGGILTIQSDGMFKLNHYDNVVSTVDSSYDRNDLLEDV